MTNAEGRALCARCGEPLLASGERCAVCNGLVPRAVLPIVPIGPLDSGARAASPSRRALSLGTSVAVPLVVGAAFAAASSPLGASATIASAVIAAFLVAAAQVAAWLRTGRAVGNLVTATRTVRADDGTAPSLRMLRGRPRASATVERARGPLGRLLGTVTVVLGKHRDPLALTVRGVASLPPRVPGTVARNAVARGVVLTFGGQRIPLVRSVILGRNPPPVGGDTVVVSLPDMSRSISKSHVRLDNEGGRVFVQDLGSTNGTDLVTAEGTRELHPGERVEMPPGAHLLLAGAPLRLETGHVSAAA